MIFEQNRLTATDQDVLNGGRLNAIPYNGTITFELQSSAFSLTNNALVTIQLPSGDVPIDRQPVLIGRAGDADNLDSGQLMRFSFPATQGGHFTLAIEISGTCTVVWRAVLSP